MINSFFKPQKRKCLEELTNSGDKNSMDVVPPSKIAKKPSSDSDQTKSITDQVKRTPILPSTIGHSWFKVLRNEFNKDYFVKVSLMFIFIRRFSNLLILIVERVYRSRTQKGYNLSSA